MNLIKLPIPFSLYRLKYGIPGNELLRGMSLDAVHRLGQRVDPSRYYRTYEGLVQHDTEPREIYDWFNTEPPRDYMGRRICVSDLIVIGKKTWYVDGLGYQDVSKEVKQARNENGGRT